jgi:gamma-glutamylcyclotransferase (GGCT)/AIG2-like uncharacterized protein YtfP
LPDLLFVYGTLRPGHAPAEIADAVDRLQPVNAGWVRGRLLDLGDYPGIILESTTDGGAGSKVPGQVLLIPDEATLERLDWYEGYSPADPEGSLFRRVRAAVMLQDGSLLEDCWIYVYNARLL